MIKPKILVLRKMSALEYYYKHKNQSLDLRVGHDNHNTGVDLVKQILTQEGISFDVFTREELSESRVLEYDALFSLGGDGTVIAAAAFNRITPQLNLVTDESSRGALCQRDIDAAITNFLSGNYHLANWTRQDVFLDGKFVARALNETCVGEDGLNFSKMAKYELETKNLDWVLGKEVTRENNWGRQENSGLVVVTGTGTSGWPAIFQPTNRDYGQFKFFTLLPAVGMSPDNHDGNRTIANYLKITYKNHKGTFAVDTIKYDLPRDSILEIKVSDSPLRVIIPNQGDEIK